MTVRAALKQGIAVLSDAGVEDAARDARLLLAGAWGVPAGRLTIMQDESVPPEVQRIYEAHLQERAGDKPVSRILGRRAFWKGEFFVNADVLDPRPDTEALVAEALSAPFSRVLDLGTGSGCILISLLGERPAASGVGTDISEAALDVARRNAREAGCTGAEFLLSDWFERVEGQFDLIVSNPPYIAIDEMAGLSRGVRDHDPHHALTDGADGLSAYRVIAQQAGAYLIEGGRLVLEIGWTQGAEVVALLREMGFAKARVLPDLEGRDRVVTAVWPG